MRGRRCTATAAGSGASGGSGCCAGAGRSWSTRSRICSEAEGCDASMCADRRRSENACWFRPPPSTSASSCAAASAKRVGPRAQVAFLFGTGHHGGVFGADHSSRGVHVGDGRDLPSGSLAIAAGGFSRHSQRLGYLGVGRSQIAKSQGAAATVGTHASTGGGVPRGRSRLPTRAALAVGRRGCGLAWRRRMRRILGRSLAQPVRRPLPPFTCSTTSIRSPAGAVPVRAAKYPTSRRIPTRRP